MAVAIPQIAAYIVGLVLAVNGLCALNQCEQDMRMGGTPSRYFEVIVRLPAEGNRLTSVRLDDWPAYHAKNPDSTLALQASSGVTDSEWVYKLLPADGGSQSVGASHTGFRITQVFYETRGETAYPLYSKATNLGYWVAGLILGAFLARLIGRLLRPAFRRWLDQ